MEPVRMAAGWLQSSIKGLGLMLGIAAIKLSRISKIVLVGQEIGRSVRKNLWAIFRI
jgi:hypothetical protein